MPLPKDCAGCVYYQPEGSRCRRHAPGPGYEEMEIAHWPVVRATDRCGLGEAIADGSSSPIACSRCVHWFQPDGKDFKPGWTQGMPDAWWRESGLCTRFPPSPSSEENRQSSWKVTHGSDRCGDAAEI